MELHYTEGWFIAKKRPCKALNPEKARLAFEKRERHTVVAGPLGQPFAFMEFYRDWIGISFLDSQLRVYLDYSFGEIEPGRVFLKMATSRHFVGDSDKVESGTSYIFKPDGSVNVREQDVINKTLREGKGKADVSGNWDFYPSFGEYDSLLRLDRSPVTFAS